MVSNDDSLVSDVQNIDTIDLDDYYIGCDSRISKSSTITNEIIKYWINAQNDLTVQRYLSLLGSAAIGDVLIKFSDTDAVKYGVPLNGAIDSYKSILKTISDSQLDYTENNATINGWIIDYLLNPNDLCTLNKVSGKENATDDNMSTYYQGSESHSSGYSAGQYSWKEMLKIDFGSIKTIQSIHAYYSHTIGSTIGNYGQTLIQYSENGTVWTTVISSASSHGQTATKHGHYNSVISARYVRVYIGVKTDDNNEYCVITTKIYDLSAFEME